MIKGTKKNLIKHQVKSKFKRMFNCNPGERVVNFAVKDVCETSTLKNIGRWSGKDVESACQTVTAIALEVLDAVLESKYITTIVKDNHQGVRNNH